MMLSSTRSVSKALSINGDTVLTADSSFAVKGRRPGQAASSARGMTQMKGRVGRSRSPLPLLLRRALQGRLLLPRRPLQSRRLRPQRFLLRRPQPPGLRPPRLRPLSPPPRSSGDRLNSYSCAGAENRPICVQTMLTHCSRSLCLVSGSRCIKGHHRLEVFGCFKRMSWGAFEDQRSLSDWSLLANM